MATTIQRNRALLGSVSALTILTGAMISPASAQVTVLDAITIIATKTEELAINALAPVSVIREDRIQQLQPTSTHQIFIGIPGITTEGSAQEGSVAINIRGLQDFGRVAVYIDGARQNYARLGHEGAGSFFLETEVLASADIVRGPTSNIYGSGAIGGVVAFRTKDVEDVLLPGQKWGIQTNVTAGTNGFNGVGSIFAASRVNPNAEYIIGGSYRNQSDYSSGNGTRIFNSGQEVGTFLAKATFRPADDHQIKLSGILYASEWVNGVPLGAPQPATSVIRDFSSINLTTSANWKYRPVGNPFIDFDSTVYYNHVDVSSLNLGYPAGTPAPTTTAYGIYGPPGTRSNYIIDTLGFDVNNTSRFVTGPWRHAFTYGVDLFNDDVQNTANFGFGAGYNPRGQRLVTGGFMQMKSNYSTWLEMITAVRYDYYSLDGTDITTGALVSTTGDRLSPKVTLGITPFAGFQPYISYAEGYRAPAITETLVSAQHPGNAFSSFLFIPNPTLRPEIGKNKEIGFNVKQDNLWANNDKLRIKASLFRNDVEDFIDTRTVPEAVGTSCPVSAAYTNCMQYANIQQAKIEGFEFESTYDRGLWFIGFAGHIMHGRDQITNAPVNKIPTAMFATTVGGRLLDERFTWAVRWTAVARKKSTEVTYSDPDGPGPSPFGPDIPLSPSYNLVNLYLGYQIDPTLLAGLSVENLLNEEYTIYTHQYAAPGVTVKLSLRKTFGPAPDPVAALTRNQNALNRPTTGL